MRKVQAARARTDASPEVAFGRVLQQIRESQSMSQDELGAKSGYHRTYISQLERGLKSPSLRTLFALAPTLKVNPSYIIEQVERRSNFRKGNRGKERIWPVNC